MRQVSTDEKDRLEKQVELATDIKYHSRDEVIELLNAAIAGKRIQWKESDGKWSDDLLFKPNVWQGLPYRIHPDDVDEAAPSQPVPVDVDARVQRLSLTLQFCITALQGCKMNELADLASSQLKEALHAE